MRKILISFGLLFAAIVWLTKPWQRYESIDEAVCAGNVFWSLGHIFDGDDINRVHFDGVRSATPLLSAADAVDCPKLLQSLWVKAIVYMGADVNIGNSYGYTPLMMATGVGDYDSVEFLIDRGARLHDVDSSNSSALDIARKINDPKILDILKGK
ncbi:MULTISPECIES: ankyrin repeat domain-containing protein [unclassified Rhizobium]|uniref:ankyrin repeat domain-containing protein n=1 Tax=unclassified Rhizobium TaxID=2613769 RepID=UPI0009EDB92F|nr:MULTISPECIES: ankyrin repeat domain-containing protein [unclassified Rhizobium]